MRLKKRRHWKWSNRKGRKGERNQINLMPKESDLQTGVEDTREEKMMELARKRKAWTE